MRPDGPAPVGASHEVRVIVLDLEIVHGGQLPGVGDAFDLRPACVHQADFIADTQFVRVRPTLRFDEERVLVSCADDLAADVQIQHQRLAYECP